MFRSVGLYAAKVAIRRAGPTNVYRDVMRLTLLTKRNEPA